MNRPLNPLSRAVRASLPSAGFTLVELALSFVVIGALAVGTIYAYQRTQTTAEVRQEQSRIQEISEKGERNYGALGSYTGVSSPAFVAAGLSPPGMASGGTLHSVWGQPVSLSATDIGLKPEAGLKIVYDAVPVRACALLAAATAEGLWDVQVNGATVLKGPSDLDATLASSRCSQNDTAQMVFTYYGGASGQVASVLAPPAWGGGQVSAPSTAAPSPSTPTAPSAPPIGPPPPPLVPLTPPVAPPPPPMPPVAPSCVVPSPATETNDQERTETQSLACPSGETGSIEQSRSQSRFQQRTASCPSPSGSVQWTAWGPWSAWSATTAWTTTSNSCVPARKAGRWIFSSSGGPEYSCQGASRYAESWSWNFQTGTSGDEECHYDANTNKNVCSKGGSGGYPGPIEFPTYPAGVQCYEGDSYTYNGCGNGVVAQEQGSCGPL